MRPAELLRQRQQSPTLHLQPGCVQILVTRGVQIDLEAAVNAAARLQPITVSPEAQAAASDFLQRRLEQMLVSTHCPKQLSAAPSSSLLHSKECSCTTCSVSVLQPAKPAVQCRRGPSPIWESSRQLKAVT